MAMVDLTGQRFGRLTALYRLDEKTKSGNFFWMCKCDCGSLKKVDTGSLRSGTTVSCGCFVRDHAKTLNYKHGGRHDRLYMVWMDMRRRCRDPKSSNYDCYGERGITVCDEWQDYSVFKEWAYASGYDETAKSFKCTLDRIDVNGNYEPSNCRWVDTVTQCNNKRNNKLITFRGETHTCTEWERLLGFENHTLAKRLYAGWSVERALTTPLRITSRTKPVK